MEEVSQELRDLYADAHLEGIFLVEFYASDEHYLAGAGPHRYLEEVGIDPEDFDTIQSLGLGDAVGLTCPGSGSTREEAVKEAIKGLKESGMMED